MELNLGTEIADSDWTHSSIEKEGKVNVFFNPHKHGSVFIEEAPDEIQTAFKLFHGWSVKTVAENIKEGSTEAITTTDIEDEFQTDIDDRIAKKEAAEAEEEPKEEPQE